MRILTAVTFTLTLLLVIVQSVFAIRGIIAPGAGAAGFGLAADSASAEFYHAVYRDRNLVIAVIALVLLLRRMWPALAVVLVVSVTLPLYDIAALKLAGVAVLPLHYITLACIAVLAALAVMRARLDRPPRA